MTALFTFDDNAKAIAMPDDYTHYLDWAHRFARERRSGTVSLKEYNEGDFTAPFGGYKASGFGGRDKGVEARRPVHGDQDGRLRGRLRAVPIA